MKIYNCMECKRRMTRNVFICDKCANSRERNDKDKKRHSGETVRTQRLSEVVTSGSDTSPYWDYVTKHNLKDEDGNIIEDARANPDALPDDGDQARRAERNRLREISDNAINALPPEEREIMRLHLKGRNDVQISKVVDMTPRGVGKLIRRITTKLAVYCRAKENEAE